MESSETNYSLLNQETDGSQPGLLFIPDISGFTRFMHESKFKYNGNLIADLLEIIIEANILNMEVCEIQGDAILFYKVGLPPSIEEIVSQGKQIFLDFQNYLRILERDGSELGAQLLESKLTLKAIVHYGRLNITRIREHTKLMGTDVIVAHRLLKNTIEGSEYLLLSDGYLATQAPEAVQRSFQWTQLKEGSTEYEHVGKVAYKYAFLTPLRLLITNPEVEHISKLHPNTYSLHVHIQAPVACVLRILQNYRLKPAWLIGVKKVTFDTSKVNRSGIYFQCEMEKGDAIEIQALQTKVAGDRAEYIEKIANFKMFPNSFLFYYLKEEEQGTQLTVEFHYSRISVGSYFYDSFGRKHIRLFLGKSLRCLKAFCEQYYHGSKQ